MDRWTDDRGVSEVVGFILIFAMLVIAFTVYQGIVVPDQNRQVEFQHNLAVQGQLQDLRNAIVTTASTGSGQAVSVTLGATYPRRSIAKNLGVSGGSIQTSEAGSGGLRIGNARALDPETRDFINGSIGPYETKSIQYTPVNSYYTGAPRTRYDNAVLYNQFDATNVTLTGQFLVDGRRITLIAINGNISRTERDTVSISTEAISVSPTRVAITNTSGHPVNVTVPTRLGASKWRALLADEMDGSGYVSGVHDVPGENAVTVTMQAGVTYDLRMAEVGVGPVTRQERPRYITDVRGNGTSVSEGGRQKLVVEVRDRFNNPVSNVSVTPVLANPANPSDSAERIVGGSETTGSDGRASFTYHAPAQVDLSKTATVNVTFGAPGAPERTASFDVTVLDSDGSGSTGGGGAGGTNTINPSTKQKTLVYVNSTIAGSKSGTVTLRLNNTASNAIDIDKVRFQFYSYTSQGSRTSPPTSLTFDGTSVDYLDQFTPVSVSVSPGVHQIPLTFYTGSGGGGSTYDVRSGDFIILTVNLGSGDNITYFLGVTQA